MTTPSPFRSSRRECDWVPGRVHLKALAQRVETEATKPEDVYVYESLFERLRRESSPDAKDGAFPLYPDDRVYPLYPKRTVTIPPATAIPVPGESIGELPTPPKSEPGIITVEVG